MVKRPCKHAVKKIHGRSDHRRRAQGTSHRPTLALPTNPCIKPWTKSTNTVHLTLSTLIIKKQGATPKVQKVMPYMSSHLSGHCRLHVQWEWLHPFKNIYSCLTNFIASVHYFTSAIELYTQLLWLSIESENLPCCFVVLASFVVKSRVV